MRKLLMLALMLLAMAPVAQARTWKPQGKVLAQDYSVITDVRAGHDIVEVIWLSSPMVGDEPAAAAILDRYLIIGAVDGQIDPTAVKLVVDTVESVKVLDGEGKPLKELSGDSLPPSASAIIAGMGGFMRQSMGELGKGMRFFAFESGNIRACGAKGQFSIVYAGETYTYDTPIPGCPAQ